MKKIFIILAFTLTFFSCSNKYEQYDKKLYNVHQIVNKEYRRLIDELIILEEDSDYSLHTKNSEILATMAGKAANELEALKMDENVEDYKKVIIKECDYVGGSCAIIHALLEQENLLEVKSDMLDYGEIERLNKSVEIEREKFLKASHDLN